jgi:anti-sigma B factor antagonist
MAFISEDVADVRVIHLIGALDLTNAVQLRNELGRITSAPTDRVLLDLSDVPSVDGSGLGVLVAAQRRAAKVGARFALADPHERVVRTLQRAGVDAAMVQVHPSVGSGTHALMAA